MILKLKFFYFFFKLLAFKAARSSLLTSFIKIISLIKTHDEVSYY